MPEIRFGRVVLLIAGALLIVAASSAHGQIFLDHYEVAKGEAIARAEQEITAFIAVVEKEDSFETLVQNLNEPSRGQVPMLLGSAFSPEERPIFDICLANRRVARLYGMLKQRPDPGRDCRDLFEEKLAILRRQLSDKIGAWERGLERYQKKHPDVDLNRDDLELDQANAIRGEIWKLGKSQVEDKKPQSDNTAFGDLFNEGMHWETSLEASTCALAAAIFLSAEFCPIEEVFRQLDAWRKLGVEFKKRYESPVKILELTMWYHRQKIEDFGQPPPRYEVSLLASLLKRRFRMEPGGTWTEDKQAMEALNNPRQRIFDEHGKVPVWMRYQRVPFFAWNATRRVFAFQSGPRRRRLRRRWRLPCPGEARSASSTPRPPRGRRRSAPIRTITGIPTC